VQVLRMKAHLGAAEAAEKNAARRGYSMKSATT
jgi:hypothetical protein